MTVKKEVTIYDIAKRLKLSASTVSRGLSGHPDIRQETIKRIRKTAQSMGYQQNTFASNLRKNRSNTIGVILPRISSNFQSAVVSGIEEMANKNGFNLIISQSKESKDKERENMVTMYNNRVDGLLVSLACDTYDLNHFNKILKKGIPIVCFDRVKDHPIYKCTKVVIDNIKAGYDATEHLAKQGCKRIVFLGDNLLSNVYSERLTGYKQALKQYKINSDPELIMIDRLDEESGKRTLSKLLKLKNRADGVFAANDTSAVALICQLKMAGIRVPEDIAVVGFNDVHISRVIDPSLTTIHYPGEEMGEVATSSLIEMINRTSPVITKTVVLEHKLIIRKSSLRTG